MKLNYIPIVTATVIADASWCPNTLAGGWAFWVSSDTFKIQKAGVFHTLQPNSTEAEKWAALNGIWYAYEAGARNILIQTDCLHVVNLINQKAIKQLNYFPEASIHARHVKGHTKRTEPRYWVNN